MALSNLQMLYIGRLNKFAINDYILFIFVTVGQIEPILANDTKKIFLGILQHSNVHLVMMIGAIQKTTHAMHAIEQTTDKPIYKSNWATMAIPS